MKEIIKVDAGLATAVFGTADLTDVDADNPDGDEINEPHPVQKAMEANRFAAALGKTSRAVRDSSWDEPLGAVTKRIEPEPTELSPLEFRKVLAKNVVKVEQVDIAGEKWQHAFNAAGELIDARILS